MINLRPSGGGKTEKSRKIDDTDGEDEIVCVDEGKNPHIT